jgi:hypothetical protein
VSQCVILIIVENYTNSEVTDMVLCYRSADGVALRAEAVYREKFPAVVQRLWENCTFRPRNVGRGP